MQAFEGYDTVVAPAEATLAGQKGVVVKATYKESLADGAEVERRAQVYAVAVGDQIWFVRCTVPVGDAFDDDVSQILASIAIEST